MTKHRTHRTHSIAFKRQVVQEYLAGETLHGLARRHDLSRTLIRIWVDKYEAGAFDERLGFRTLLDAGFEEGNPIIMQHPSGVALKLLGPADMPNDRNILMDTEEKYPGITHVSFKVASIDDVRRFLADRDIPLSSQFSFKDLRAVFFRDPDRNLIELDAYAGEEPETRWADEGLIGHKANPQSQ